MTTTIWTARLAIVLSLVAIGISVAKERARVEVTVLTAEQPAQWTWTNPNALPAIPGLDYPKR